MMMVVMMMVVMMMVMMVGWSWFIGYRGWPVFY